MPDFVRPVDAVHAALPGTLADLQERTGYTVGAILEAMRRLTAEGTVVRAVMGERDGEGGWTPTTYTLLTVVAGQE